MYNKSKKKPKRRKNMTRKVLNLISLSGQALIYFFSLFVIVTTVIGYIDLRNTTATDMSTSIGVGLGAVVLIIVGMFALIYSAIAIVPFITKLTRTFGKGRGADIVAIVFDTLLLIANIVFIFAFLTADLYILCITVALAVVTIGCLVLNCLTVRYKKIKD